MKLLGIEFHGFKSFADSANIRFHEGITAIVGPNGCGKSNISDGLRWVLGEQRPTAIRGSRMEEAIFQGTERRKPIHRAEVTLHLSNEDHLLPVPYSEVKIGRSVFSGGEGEYRLNGTLCRLRDVQDLCRDTGLGSNAYAIIEGRMVDAILSDRAEERRTMFEEAAGIGRYKERRRVAVRRLDEADADLARVDDLISEVATKVRSLARQRGRARRFIEMRERKLAVELALAHAELARLGHRRIEIEAEFQGLDEARVKDATELHTAEAEHERVRTALADLERRRAASARELIGVRDRLSEREKRRLLAEERTRHSRTRLEQLEIERRELSEQRSLLEEAVERLREQVDERGSSLAALRERLQREHGVLAEVSERRQAIEAAEAAVKSEQQAYHEERARLQAGVQSAHAEARELARRVEEAERRLAENERALQVVTSAEEETRTEALSARQRLEELARGIETELARLRELEAEREEVRGQQAELVERVRAISARIADLRALVSGGEGFSAAVQAALARAAELGVRGVLGRELEVPEPYAEAVESYLGSFMEALLVDAEEDVNRIRRWFVDDYAGAGGLVVLPLNSVPDRGMQLPPGVRVRGPGAAWLAYLLRGVTLEAGEPRAGRGWIGRRESVNPDGVVRLGRPHAGSGLLARRAELERALAQKEELEAQSQRVVELVRECAERVTTQATRVRELETSRRRAEEEAGKLAARAEATGEKLTRAREDRELGAQALARLEAERVAALDRGVADQHALDGLHPVGSESAPDPEELSAVRAEWERLREQVTEIQLQETRSAAELQQLERELRSREAESQTTATRFERLGEESRQLEKTEAEAVEEMESAARDLETLFAEQTRAEQSSREMDEQVEELRRTAAELETSLRRVHQAERSHSERRHQLELEVAQIDAELKRTRERLEDEWGRPFESLSREAEAAEGEPVALREELSQLAEQLGRIGLVNMLAEREYQDEKERLEFLENQRSDLAKARDDLRDTIRQINETASKAFLETLDQIRANFSRTFGTLFPGGECDVWLEDPEAPLDSPVEISASPGGKRTQRIHLLSGGERALTALALLFAIYLVKPSPFCVLDEVDAPLDETNIRRFVDMLEGFKASVQFIVITHNPVTIEAADWIYGVTMEEPGVSKIVGVEFSDYARGAVA